MTYLHILNKLPLLKGENLILYLINAPNINVKLKMRQCFLYCNLFLCQNDTDIVFLQEIEGWRRWLPQLPPVPELGPVTFLSGLNVIQY